MEYIRDNACDAKNMKCFNSLSLFMHMYHHLHCTHVHFGGFCSSLMSMSISVSHNLGFATVA